MYNVSQLQTSRSLSIAETQTEQPKAIMSSEVVKCNISDICGRPFRIGNCDMVLWVISVGFPL